MEELIGAQNLQFLISLGVALVCGLLIGLERELRGKPAGLSTQTLVITASMLFTFLSQVLLEADPTRIAAQVVSGIGFLGAGIILKSEGKGIITNVTTAASIWFGASVGMAIGFEMYFIALVASVYAVLVTRIPHVRRLKEVRQRAKEEFVE